MNSRFFKLIFSRRLNALVAVGENCSSEGKSSSASLSSSIFTDFSDKNINLSARFAGVLALGFIWVASAFADPAINALPVGGSVAQGSASIAQQANQMVINQATDKAVINWQGFDIGAAASINVLQPNSSSVLLNRVVGNDPSQIFGTLTANGHVILVNPNGIVFGADGSVTASAFTASTLGISDADFMAGNYRFVANGSAGSILNQGSINATSGYVALLGANVTNDGKVTTTQGNVYMGAAQAITVPVSNSGRIRMELDPSSVNAAVNNTQNGVIVTSGGQVLMQASAVNDAMATASVSHAGQINTTAAQAGNVRLLADGGNIRVSGTINANSTDTNNKGGNIIIGRDVDTGVLAATTDVSNATLQAKGGFVETSGEYLQTSGVKVQAKEWLLDPSDIIISAASDSNVTGTSPATITPTSGSNSSVVSVSTIEGALNAGTSVTISTANTGTAGTAPGNINVNDSILKSGGGAATLSLLADRNIIVAAGKTITSTVDKLNVVFNANSSDTGGGVIFNTGSGITSNGGNITLGGGSALTGGGFAVADGANTLRGISLNGANIIAGGGNIVMNGQTAVTNYQVNLSNVAGIYMNGGAISTTGAGTITLTGKNQNTDTQSQGFVLASGTITGGSTGAVNITGDSRGVVSSTSTYIRGALINGTVDSAGGNVSLTGFGGSGAQYDYGVDIGGSIKAVGTGTLSITGTAGAGASGGNVGVNTSGAGNISSVDGALSITGTGGIGSGAQIRDHGVQIGGTNAIKATGTGGITVTGTATNNDNGFSQGVAINTGGLNTNSGNIKIDGAVLQNYQVADYINAPITSTSGNIYIRSAGANIQNTATGTISGNNVSIDNTGGTIDANGVITKGAGGASSWSGVISQDGINLNGSVTASNNLNVYGNQTGFSSGVSISGAAVTVTGKNVTLYGNNTSTGNGVTLTASTLSGAYLNVTGNANTGYTGFAWSGGNINTTGTSGTSTASTVKGISAASTTASNGYGAFMMYANGATNAANGTTLTLAGEATTLTTSQNTKERGILVQGGRILTASGDITLDGSSKSSEGIAFGGTLNMATVTGVTNKLTIKGTAAASSNSSLNAVNMSGTINGNAATSSINILGDAKNLSGTAWDSGVNISGAITGSTANVNIQSTGAAIVTTAAITGNNISIENTSGTINASTGAITAGSAQSSNGAISIGGNVTATGNLNMYGASNGNVGITVLASKAISGANIQATGKTTNGADGVIFNLNDTVTTTGTSGDSLIQGITTTGGVNGLFAWGGLGLNAATGTTLTLFGNATNTSDRAARFDGGGTITGAVTLKGTSNSSDALILINGNMTEAANSALTLTGTTSAASKIGVYLVNSGGVVLNNGSTLNITGQSTNVTGTGTGVALGVAITKASGATTAGNVTIAGSTSSASGTGSTGVNVASAITTDGTISITGTIVPTNTANTGVNIAAAITGTTSTSSASAINIQSNGNIADSSSITSSGTGGITIAAGDGTGTSTAAFTATAAATITQAGTGNVTVSTSGLGNLTTAKITNSGTGNVTLAAGTALLAGNSAGGQVLTPYVSNTVTGNKVYVYSGSLTGTGNLSTINSGFANLSLVGSGLTTNAQMNTAYGSTIASGSNTQVLFRENALPSAFDLSLNNISKVYGTADVTGANLITALGAAYTGISTLTKTTGNNIFAMSAATAINGLNVASATRAAGENVNGGTPYVYSGITNNGQNVTLSNQPGLVITQKALTVTANNISSTYDGASSYQTLATSAGVSSSGLVNATVDGVVINDSVTGATSTFASGSTIGSGAAITGSGVAQAGNFNRTIDTATGTGLSNYTITYVGNTGEVAKADLTLSGTRIYDAGKTFAGTYLTATGVAGETFLIMGAGDASNLSSKNVQTGSTLSSVTGLILGTSSNGGLSTNYNALSTTGSSVNVAAKTVTLTAGFVTKTYDATTTYTTTQGDLNALSGQLIVGDTVTAATIAYTDINYGIGNRVVTLNSVTLNDGNNGNNYSVSFAGNNTSTINKATLTASLTGTVQKVYDGLTTANNITSANYSIVGLATGEGLSVTQTAGSYASKDVSANAGAGSVSAQLSATNFTASSGTDLNNYNLPTTATGNVGKITPKALTVQANNSATFVTLDPNGAVDNGFKYTGFENGETQLTALTGSVTRTYTGVANPVVSPYAGVYDVDITRLSANNGNYSISPSATKGNLEVLAAGKLLVNIAGNTKTYGDLTAASAGASSGGVTASYYTDSNGGFISNLIVSNLGNGQWKATDTTGAYVTFNTLIDSTGHVSTGGYLNVGSYTYGVSSLVVTGTPNFQHSFVNPGVLTVNAKAITLNTTGLSKVYDGNTNFSNATLGTDKLSGDLVTATGTTGVLSQHDVGTHQLTLNGIVLTGADRNNYSAPNSLSTTGSITPKALTISNSSTANKVYDGNANAIVTTGTLSGLVGNEELNVSASGLFDDALVGANKRVTATYALADGMNGGRASNYYLLPEFLRAEITGKQSLKPDNKPFVNPVTPKSVTPNGSGSKSQVSLSTTAQSVDVKLAAIDKPSIAEQCSANSGRSEKCDCQKTLFENVMLCKVPLEGSGQPAHATKKAKAHLNLN